MSNPYDKQVGGNHYQNMKIQPAEFINKNKLPFAEGNAIKYICRHINKGGEQDLKKAKHYIDMIIDRDYGDDAEQSKTFSGLSVCGFFGSINLFIFNLQLSHLRSYLAVDLHLHMILIDLKRSYFVQRHRHSLYQ